MHAPSDPRALPGACCKSIQDFCSILDSLACSTCLKAALGEGRLPCSSFVTAENAFVSPTMEGPAGPSTEAGGNAMEDEVVCRICRLEGTPEEPLLHPCKCSGSIRFIHETCLQQWLTVSKRHHCEVELLSDHALMTAHDWDSCLDSGHGLACWFCLLSHFTRLVTGLKCCMSNFQPCFDKVLECISAMMCNHSFEGSCKMDHDLTHHISYQGKHLVFKVSITFDMQAKETDSWSRVKLFVIQKSLQKRLLGLLANQAFQVLLAGLHGNCCIMSYIA